MWFLLTLFVVGLPIMCVVTPTLLPQLMKLYKMEGRNIPNITSFAVDVMQVYIT